jgi:RNA polymerase sigma-70 factor (family 1)
MIQARTKPAETLSFDGSKAGFEALFKALYSPLTRYAMLHHKDADEAEDMVQQVFVKLWQQKDKLQADNIKSYLYRSVYHECVNRARHSQVKGTYMENNLRELNAAAAHAHEAAEGKELEKKISKALEELPEQCGKAFRLSRFHHLSYAEIAQVMEISVKTVENHMGKALSIMRTKLADYLVIIFILTNFLNQQP